MIFNKNKIYILAGATGTEIQRRGFQTTLPLWSAKVLFEQPELLKQIYIDYINAGADIIVTNTFRTQRRTLKKVGLESHVERINKLATKICFDAIKESGTERKILVAGSVTTLEDCYRVDLIPSDIELNTEHTEQINLLTSTNVDFLLLETFNSIKEVVVAAKIAKKTNKPFVISFTLGKDANLLTGETLADAVKAVEVFDPEAILVNCVAPDVASKALEKIKTLTNITFGAYANGDGAPADDLGWKFTGHDPVESYFEYCKNWKSLGATIIGGCCGTSPEYTKLYSQLK